MEHEKPQSERENEDDALNDSWFDRPGRSLVPTRYPSERPSYEYADTRPSDMELDDAWFV